MPRVDFSCNYCGHRFFEYLYSEDQADSIRCGKCDDKDVVIELNKECDRDPYGYSKDKQSKDAYIRKR